METRLTHARHEPIPQFRNPRENGYELWTQWFLGSFGWTSVSYDWSVDGIQGNHWPIISSPCPPKKSNKSLRLKLVPIPLISEIGNSSFGTGGAFHWTKSQFEISEISRAQWTGTFRLLRPDPSHRAFGYCSCKQDTKERYCGQQFCQMERDISSDRPK